MSLAKELLSSVKNKCRITWDHEDDDVLEMIEEGMAFLEERCGDLPFTLDDKTRLAKAARKLLKDYCRYERAGSGAWFKSDYKSEILNLQLQAAIERKKEAREKRKSKT